MLCSSVILKKYKKIQKLNIREKEVMFLHSPSLPCILWLVSSLIMSSDDFPAHRRNVDQGTPSLTFLGGTSWSRAASGSEASGLGLRVLCHSKQSDPFNAVPGNEESRLAGNRCEMGLPGGEAVGKTAVHTSEVSTCLQPLVWFGGFLIS